MGGPNRLCEPQSSYTFCNGCSFIGKNCLHLLISWVHKRLPGNRSRRASRLTTGPMRQFYAASQATTTPSHHLEPLQRLMAPGSENVPTKVIRKVLPASGTRLGQSFTQPRIRQDPFACGLPGHALHWRVQSARRVARVVFRDTCSQFLTTTTLHLLHLPVDKSALPRARGIQLFRAPPSLDIAPNARLSSGIYIYAWNLAGHKVCEMALFFYLSGLTETWTFDGDEYAGVAIKHGL